MLDMTDEGDGVPPFRLWIRQKSCIERAICNGNRISAHCRMHGKDFPLHFPIESMNKKRALAWLLIPALRYSSFPVNGALAQRPHARAPETKALRETVLPKNSSDPSLGFENGFFKAIDCVHISSSGLGASGRIGSCSRGRPPY